MVDVKHRLAYARIKMTGVREDVVINDGLSFIQLAPKVTIAIASMPARYEGVITVEYSFKPINAIETEFEKYQREVMAGLDLSQVELATDEESEAIQQAWAKNPMNPQSDSYDVLYHEYQMCSSPKRRESKTPQDLQTLRNHIESLYRGTVWWDGSHTW